MLLSILQLCFTGFKFQILNGLHALQVILSPRDAKEDQNKTTGYGSSEGETLVSEASPDSAPNAAGEDIPGSEDKVFLQHYGLVFNVVYFGVPYID